MECENKKWTTERILRNVYFGHKYMSTLSPHNISLSSKDAILGQWIAKYMLCGFRKNLLGLAKSLAYEDWIHLTHGSKSSAIQIWLWYFPHVRNLLLFDPDPLFGSSLLTRRGLIVHSQTQTLHPSGTSNSPTPKEGLDLSCVWSLLPCLVVFVCPNLSYSYLISLLTSSQAKIVTTVRK